MKILCVCLGNICRSPTAEGVLKSLLKEKNIEGAQVDSAGTSAWHEGEAPDARSTRHAALRGYKLEGASRQVKEDDFVDYDFILAMDQKNFFDLEKVRGFVDPETIKARLLLFTDYCKIHDIRGVPDPYQKGEEGFELVLDIIEDASKEFIAKELQG